MKVAIMYGDVPEGAPLDEQDGLVEVEAVSAALATLGYEPVPLPVTLDLKKTVEALSAIRPGFVFNIVESLEGTGRFIHLAPAVLDYLRIPYTGAPAESLFMTSNKLVSKKTLRAAGIPTPDWFSPEDAPGDPRPLDGRYIIKSVWEHASIGIDEGSVLFPKDTAALAREISARRETLGGGAFAEAFIEGREFNLSVLDGQEGDGGPEVFPPAEIVFVDYPDDKLKVVDYKAKWVEDSFEYDNTPRSFEFPESDKPLLLKLQGIARDCWHAFGVHGYARVDFRVDGSGRPFVLEVNANPCITPYSGFIAAMDRGGLTYAQVVERLIKAMQARV